MLHGCTNKQILANSFSVIFNGISFASKQARDRINHHPDHHGDRTLPCCSPPPLLHPLRGCHGDCFHALHREWHDFRGVARVQRYDDPCPPPRPAGPTDTWNLPPAEHNIITKQCHKATIITE